MANVVVDWLKRMSLPRFLNLLAVALLVLLVVRVQRGTGESPPDERVVPREQREDTTQTPVEEPTPPADTEAASLFGDSGVVARALAAQPPDDRVNGVGIVDQVMPPRSFWLKQDTARMLVIMVAVGPDPQVRARDHVHLQFAKIKWDRDTSEIPKNAGPDAKAAAARQPVFLMIQTGRVKVVSRNSESN